MKHKVSIIIFFVLSQPFATEASPAIKLSDLEGKYGISVVYGKRCPDCCDLEFSNDFGYHNTVELNELRNLLENTYENDLNCMPLDYYVLDYLVFLATNKQDKKAASLLLYPDAYGGLNISGELAELFSLERQAPILTKYKNLKSILIPGTETTIIENICKQALLILGEERPANEFIRGLRDNKQHNLAEIAIMKCNKIAEETTRVRRNDSK